MNFFEKSIEIYVSFHRVCIQYIPSLRSIVQSKGDNILCDFALRSNLCIRISSNYYRMCFFCFMLSFFRLLIMLSSFYPYMICKFYIICLKCDCFHWNFSRIGYNRIIGLLSSFTNFSGCSCVSLISVMHTEFIV